MTNPTLSSTAKMIENMSDLVAKAEVLGKFGFALAIPGCPREYKIGARSLYRKIYCETYKSLVHSLKQDIEELKGEG